MDIAVFQWFNGWNGQLPIVGDILAVADGFVIKSVPFMMAFWGLWFWPKTETERTQMRNALAATLLLAIPVIGLTRAVANYAPYSPRPLQTDGLMVNLYEGQNAAILDGWSSMPSDHASLFMGLAVALFFIHRGVGAFFIFWSIVVVSIPRIIVGYHWPSDILVGWILGAAVMLILIRPATKIVERSRIVPYFEAREAVGYPLLFLATYDVARLFENTRSIIEGLI